MTDQSKAMTTTGETASSNQLTASSALERVRALPERLDDETLRNVELFAHSEPPQIPLSDREYVILFIRLMSDLPRRADDEMTGEIRKQNLIEHLVGKPKPQLDWLRREAHLRFKFFPTVKELIELAGEWVRNDAGIEARKLAKRLAERERQTRMAEARKRLKYEECEPEWIDALSPSEQEIFVSERLLKRAPDGTITQSSHWREWEEFRNSITEKEPAP